MVYMCEVSVIPTAYLVIPFMCFKLWLDSWKKILKFQRVVAGKKQKYNDKMVAIYFVGI